MNKYTFIAGAGISRDSPSEFPIATQITDSIIDSIAPDNGIKERLKKSNIRDCARAESKLTGDFVRFEMLIDAVSNCDPDLGVLDAIKNYKNPNLNHYNLAMLAINGHHVFTPNFDDLIERAIRALGYDPITICTEEDYRLFSFRRKRCIPVFKLHGSYYRYTGNGNRKRVVKSTMQASLTSIMTDKSELQLSASKTRILKRSLRYTSDLIFVGYSGSDDFDIIPSLLNLNIGHITWINHDDNICLTNKVASIKDRATGRNRLISKQLEKDPKSVELYDTNTRHFLTKLGDVSRAPDMKRRPVGVDFPHHIARWGEHLSEDEKHFIVGELLFRLSLFRESYDMHEHVSPHSSYHIGSQLRCVSCLDQTSEYKKALRKLQRLKRFPDIRKHDKYLDIIEKEAYLRYRISSNDRKSGVLFETVVNSAKADSAILQSATNNYALFLRDNFCNKKAWDFYKRSRDIATRRGDSEHWCKVVNNMATLLYDQGKFIQAEHMCREGIKRADMLGDNRQVGVFENFLANIYFIKGDSERAAEYCERSRIRDEEIGNESDSAVNELLLGQCFFEKAQFERAKEHYDESERLFRRSDDKYFLYELIFYRIIYELHAGNIESAETIYRHFSEAPTNTLQGIYQNIANKLLLFFRKRGGIEFKKEIASFIEDDANREIIGYINVVYYLSLLGIPADSIGKQHLIKAKNIYRRLGNSSRLRYIESRLRQ